MLTVTASSVSYILMWYSSGFCSRSASTHHYMTTLSTLISSLSLNHHLLPTIHNFFSPFTWALTLTPASPTSNVLQNYWYILMDVCQPFDSLTLQKLFLLLTVLKQQLAKINSCSLDTVHSARNLGFILMNILLFLTRYLLFLNPATHIFVNFDASVHILVNVPNRYSHVLSERAEGL